MFIVAPFTIAKTWKQPKCPSTDEWVKKMWYIYTMEYYLTIKKNKIMLDLEIVILSEVSQAEKDIYHMTSLTYGKKKNLIQMNLVTKHKETHRLRKQTYGCWGAEEG